MNRLNLALSTLVTLLALHTPGSAQTIVRYTFEGDTTTPDIGSGISSISWSTGESEKFASEFSGQGRSISISGFSNSDYYEITLDATGLQNIVVQDFRANGSPAAPRDWVLGYSTSGSEGTFVNSSPFLLSRLTGVSSTTITGLALPDSANDNPNVVIRMLAISSIRIDEAPGLADGTVRLDNFTITGTAIPEPSTYALLAGCGALGFAFWRRRKKT